MLKPQTLRAALTAQCPWVAANPDKLLVFIDHGGINATGAKSLSFEYRYTLNLVLTDWEGHPSAVLVPLLAWLVDNQPEALLNPALAESAITFEADILSHETMDLSIKVQLTERVVVRRDASGTYLAEHVPEPTLDPWAGVESWEAVFVQPNTAPGWTEPNPPPA